MSSAAMFDDPELAVLACRVARAVLAPRSRPAGRAPAPFGSRAEAGRRDEEFGYRTTPHLRARAARRCVGDNA